jgi:hypothetical protein
MSSLKSPQHDHIPNPWAPEFIQAPLLPDELDLVYPPDIHSQTRTDPLTCLRFEFQSSHLKAHLLHKELTSRFKSTIDQQLMRIRRAKDNIRTYTTLKSVQKSLINDYVKSGTLPQELIQNVSLMARCKMKIRELFVSLKKLIQNFNEGDMIIAAHPNMDKIMYGSSEVIVSVPAFQANRRIEPRFDIKDYDADEDDSEEDEEDPTEKIKCCICFSGHVGEVDNDVLMCDGQGCMRAFHMKCIVPHVTQKMLDDDNEGTWFCPFCTTFANFIHYTRIEYLGDEIKEHHRGKMDDSVDDMSDDSWDEAEDVFSEAPMELDAAELWFTRCRNDKSDTYLKSILGIHVPRMNSIRNSTDVIAYQTPQNKRKRNKKTCTKSGTPDREVIQEQEKEDNHGLNKSGGRRRIDKVIHTSTREDENNQYAFLESIHSSNIMHGKRLRTKVDYKRYMIIHILFIMHRYDSSQLYITCNIRLNETLSAEESDDSSTHLEHIDK